MQGLLGTISDLIPASVFPLSGLSAETAGRNRVALVGEASHVIPPIGAQGLNLGLRDAAALADCVADALAKGWDPGGEAALETYARARATDISTRVIGVDLLNRSLIADILPTHLARGLGLHLLNAISPLRRFLVREGLQPSLSTPRLMRTRYDRQAGRSLTEGQPTWISYGTPLESPGGGTFCSLPRCP